MKRRDYILKQILHSFAQMQAGNIYFIKKVRVFTFHLRYDCVFNYSLHCVETSLTFAWHELNKITLVEEKKKKQALWKCVCQLNRQDWGQTRRRCVLTVPGSPNRLHVKTCCAFVPSYFHPSSLPAFTPCGFLVHFAAKISSIRSTL